MTAFRNHFGKMILQRVKNELKARSKRVAALKKWFWEEEEMYCRGDEVFSGKRQKRDLRPWAEGCLGGREDALRQMGMVARKVGRRVKGPRGSERRNWGCQKGGFVLGLEFLSPQFYFNKYKHPNVQKFRKRGLSTSAEVTRSAGQGDEEGRRGSKVLKGV